MNNIDIEIETLNKIIEKAIEHGAGMGGGFDSGEELKDLMEKYLDEKGLKDKYCIDNPDWIKSRPGYNGIELDTYLCFKKIY